jgi:feruloyl esterase
MSRTTSSLGQLREWVFLLGTGWLVHAPAASAADYLDLPVVKPVMSCEQLSKVDLSKTAGTTVTFTVTVVQTPKGPFCKVAGDVEPANSFEVNLPVEHWTQRYVQSAQGNIAINNAGSCAPATNGDVVVGVDSRTGSRAREDWQKDPQQRIAFAYLLNHQTALMAKALIKVFYGQAQRFSYFTGCSGGGREVLIEAQRYPEDFDGIAAGAPNILLNVHNGGFYHLWESHVNRRADGSLILTRDRLSILHDAAVAHCATASDVMDGILQMPTACGFDPAWVRCPAGASDTSKCLNAAETAVAQRLYQGSSDSSGRGFEMGGLPLGSERLWPLGLRAGGAGANRGAELRYLLPMSYANQTDAALDAAFQFDQQSFDQLGVLAPLYNGADTNLRPFQQRGSKLLLWVGAEDTTVQQRSVIAYYQGVQNVLGAPLTDSFMRFFLLPGVGHCSGGEGPAQVDVLSPLMAWVELQRKPEMIVAGKPGNQRSGIPGESGQGAANAAPRMPLAPAAQPVVLQRPVFPFPNVARYEGKGDKNDPASYKAVKSSVKTPQEWNSRAEKLIGPDNHAFYRAENGQLVADKAGTK